jgi:multicomponent K+:H+ antiporter subunit D
VTHWIVAPIVLPAVAGVLLALIAGHRRLERAIGAAATAGLLAVAILLVTQAAQGGYAVYAVGNWRPPFGIVLVLDRLSAMMLLLTAILALAALLYALGGVDRRGTLFHALFQFQLMGLNGAFLTGDLFNLFVFFEVLLIASYCLLLHERADAALTAGLHYVVVNLVGSALFLIALGLLYSVTGTLNMADLAGKVSALPPDDQVLVRAASQLLLVVFALKAALFPLSMWLPGAYAAAAVPVAALFVIMTKVGVYCILRVASVVLVPLLSGSVHYARLGLLVAGAATMAIGALGALAERRLLRAGAYLVLLSVGTVLLMVASARPAPLAAGLFYLVHSALAGGLLFLVAGEIAAQRGSAQDRLRRSAPLARPVLLGTVFLISAAAIVGVPPFSGFLAKALLLQATAALPRAMTITVWSAVLLSSFCALICLVRAGITVFWAYRRSAPERDAGGGLPGLVGSAALLGCLLALTVMAEPVRSYTDAVATQLLDSAAYVEAVRRTTGR